MGTVVISPLVVRTITQITVSATAQDISINGRPFQIMNTHASVKVYIKEKNDVAATTANGWLIPVGTTFPTLTIPVTAEVISLIGDGDGTAQLIIYD